MLYLVKMTNLDNVTQAVPPPHVMQNIEQVVIPSFEILIKLEGQKKVLASGAVVGARAGVAIIEAASNDELNELLAGLPLWGYCQTEVIPLISMKSQLALTRKMVEQMKAMTKR